MDIIYRRFIYYLVGCMGARSALTYLVKQRIFSQIGIIPLVMGMGFLYIYFYGSQSADEQLKWANAKVWWNDYRVVHGIIYSTAGLLSLYNHPCAWMLLAVDTFLGLVLFLHYHSNKQVNQQGGGSQSITKILKDLIGYKDKKEFPSLKPLTPGHPEVLHSLIKMGLMNTPQMHEFATANPDLAFEMLHNKKFPDSESTMSR